MEASIFFNRQTRTTIVGVVLSKPISLKDFHKQCEDALQQTMQFFNPFSIIRVYNLEIEDMHPHADRLLKKIETTLVFRVKLHYGYQRRKKKRSPWYKRVKQTAGVSYGSFTQKAGMIWCDDIFVRFHFIQTTNPSSLS